jgi:hypothetical protein
MLSLLAATALGQGRAPDGGAVQSCGTCHGEERHAFERDAHARVGLDCTSCHGGRAGTLEGDLAHGEDLQALGESLAVVESCGGCHSDSQRVLGSGLRTDQLSLYWTSAHGRLLAEQPDAEVATCTDCHGAHGVRRTSDPRSPAHPFRQPETCGRCHADAELSGQHGLSATVVEDYLNSVHGRALIEQGHLAAPSCADCHGAHGAQPRAATRIEMVCGSCHSVVQEYFEESPHFAADGSSPVQCATCHAEHAVEPPSAAMFLDGGAGHCGACHEGDAGAATARRIHEQLVEFAAEIDATAAEIDSAAGRGLYMESRRGYVEEAQALLVRARAMTHAAQPEHLVDVLSRGDAMLDRTVEELSLETRASRDIRIFTSLFFGVSLAFAIVLMMYARVLRGRWKEAAPGGHRGGGGPG